MTTPVSQACAELKQEAITDFTTSVPVPPGTSAPFGSKCMDTSISWSGLTNYYQVSGWCTSVPSFSNSNNGCGCSYNSANGSPPN